MGATRSRRSRVSGRRILAYLGVAVVVALLGTGWFYARQVYRTDFSAAGRMKKRGFGQQMDKDASTGPPLWNMVRNAEREYGSDGRGFLSAVNLLRTYREAIDAPDSALGKPMMSYILNNAAWFLATTDHLLLRNPADAVRMAGEAVRLTRGNEPMYLDTLAEALFRVGRTRNALETEYRALELAPDAPYLFPQIERFRRAIESSEAFDPSSPPGPFNSHFR